MSKTYRITILGCRVNHAEAREMESVLRSRGLIKAPKAGPADLHLIHTCSVTAVAAAKSRRAIRSAARRGSVSFSDAGGGDGMSAVGAQGSAPRVMTGQSHLSYGDSHIIVTGCFASSDADRITPEPGVGMAVIGHEADDGTPLIERFTAGLDDWLAGIDDGDRRAVMVPPPNASAQPSAGDRILPLAATAPAAGAGAHVRAELKIQDGCDAHCTFCIVSKLRRTLRSKRISDAVDEARKLVDLGHREIVLTGIFIGAYGHETALRRRQSPMPSHPLADLLDTVAQVPGLARLRISSMEPGDLTQPLLDAMIANRPVVVPHLHLPLQSGSDRVLRRMNRQYGTGDYLEMIDRVNEGLTTSDGIPPAITTDIICGFPGETDDDFSRTVEIARRVGYLHMHVFPYSVRPGTAAARWTDLQLPTVVVRSRVQTLIDLESDPADGLSVRFRRRLLGQTVRVILEQPSRTSEGVMTGRCDHYALVSIGTSMPRGELVEAKITEVTPDQTRGDIVARPVSLPLL